MGLTRSISEDDGGAPATASAHYSEGWAWVRVRGAFFPDRIEAQPGERLRIVFRREETAPCSEQIVIPSLGRSLTLPAFRDIPVDLGPLPVGDHEFGCELGVLRGHIVVTDPESPGLAATPHRETVFNTDGEPRTHSYGASYANAPERRPRHMRRPTINITPGERLGRILVGLAGVIGGLILLGSAGGAVAVVLEVLLVLAGLDLIVTGALGHCPLYRKLGYTPPSLRRPA